MANKPKVEVRKSKRFLKYVFTTDEAKENAGNMARSIKEVSQIENELASVKSSFKSKLDLASAEIKQLAEHVANGYEFRNIEVDVTLDFSDRRVYVHRTDNQELVEDRKMNADEMQLELS